MEGGGFDIDILQQDARIRWLKPSEILFILQNHEKYEITEEVPNKPPSGSLWLFNRRVLRFFRKDGYIWQRKKDGRTAEGHERLKVGDAHALNCYYARREQDQYFQRRSYWMLDPAYDHIVLVHYREISEGRCRSGSTLENTCSSISQRSSLNNTQDVGLAAGSNEINFDDDEVEGIPRHEEVSVHLDFENGDTMYRTTENIERGLGEHNPDYHLDCGNMQHDCSIISFPRDSEVDLRQNLRSLENEHNIEGNKATLWKDVLDFSDFAEIHETTSGVMLVESDPGPAPINTYASGDEPIMEDMDFPENDRLLLSSDTALQSLCTKYDMLGGEPNYCKKASVKCQYSANSLEQQLSEARTAIYSYKDFQEREENSHFAFDTGSQAKSFEEMLNQENDNVWEGGTELTSHMVHSTDCLGLLSGLNGSMPHPVSKPFEADKQIFSIREISPDWGFSSDSTKVIITGDFLSVPSESSWGVMFGDVEVPVEIIQDGVLRCQSPKHVPGIVKLYVTSGNLKPCSQIKEFKYVVHPESTSTSDQPQKNGAKTSEELLLLLRFAQLLLFRSDSASVQEKDHSEGETDPSGDLNLNNDEWHRINETVLSGYENPTDVIYWMLQQFLRDKLHLWLFSKRQKDMDCSLTKQEKCMIHMISGLGYEWALNSLLNCGVGINFRDDNGWTALHWAARFGREKMVAALLAAGACPGAVTDPTSQDPLGKTAASISENSGYKGIAAYLSEVALTTHLSSLRIGETVGSLESINLEAEKTWRTLSETTNQRHPSALEEQLSLEDSLTAVRNAAQAAARIQAAFRAHSFKKKQQELAARFDECYSTPEDIHGLSAALRFQSGGDNHKHRAALCIQKKFRGWKRRRGFLALRHNVVKIQAHVRGHQVRKRYKEILWTVSVVEKAVLRWRRKGTGLRGFHLDSESVGGTEDSKEEEEDILKAFRKLKVDASLKAAVARVVSMVAYPEARQQYRRVLGSYRQFKAETHNAPEPKWNSCGDEESENDDTFMRMLDEWLNLE